MVLAASTCAVLAVLQVAAVNSFERRRLDNGLQALAVDDGQRETVSVFVVYAVGNRAETRETTGLAHLCEHAMFTGTASTPAGKHDAAIQALGGESNAYTRDDYTVYYDHKVPPAALEQVLRLEADRMRGLTWSEGAFAHERQRLEEEEQRSNDPQVQLAAKREHEVWGGRGYGAGLLDARGNTRGPGLSLAQVRAFHDAWYHPRNAVVVVVGGEPAAALDAIGRAFGGLPAGPPPPELPGVAAGELPREVRLEAPLSRERVEWVWVGPSLLETDQRLALRLLAELMERRTAPDGSPVEVGMGDRAGPDLFLIGATGPGAAEAVRAAWGELLGGAWDEARLVAARRRLVAQELEKPLRSRPYFSLAVDVAVLSALGQPDLLRELEGRLNRLGRAELLRAAETWLVPARRIAFTWAATAGEVAPLPSDREGLKTAAQAAQASGDLGRAIAAYERLLELRPGRIDTVIYLYELGGLHRQRGELAQAREKLLAALKVVEYPAVRELLNEVEAEIQKGGGAPPATPPQQPPAGAAPPPHGATPPQHPPHGAAPAPAPTRRVAVQGGELPPSWASEAEQVLAELERWRGLAFQRPVVVEVLPEDPDGPAGWYEPGKGRLVVTRKGSAKFGRGVMLHELFHALQDQSHDLTKVDGTARDADMTRAIQALIEGEAMLAVQELMHYDFAQHAHLPAEGPLDEARYQKLFHYGAGLQFVLAVRDARGWAGVSAAFQDPPRSSAEVFHPARYLRRTAPGALPAPAPAAAPPLAVDADGQALPDRVEGEYGLRVFAARDAATRPHHEALGAALTVDLHRRARLADGRVRHAWRLGFASPEEAAAFHAVARVGLKAMPGLVAGSEQVECGEDQVILRWTGPAEE